MEFLESKPLLLITEVMPDILIILESREEVVLARVLVDVLL